MIWCVHIKKKIRKTFSFRQVKPHSVLPGFHVYDSVILHLVFVVSKFLHDCSFGAVS